MGYKTGYIAGMKLAKDQIQAMRAAMPKELNDAQKGVAQALDNLIEWCDDEARDASDWSEDGIYVTGGNQ